MEPEIRQERLLYVVAWGLVLLAVPGVFLFLWINGTDSRFELSGMLSTWGKILPFLVLFTVHDLLVSPLLMKRKKTGAYLLATAALLAVFGLYVSRFDHPRDMHQPPRPDAEMRWEGMPGPPRQDRPGGPGMPPWEPGPDGYRGDRPLRPEALKVIMGLMLVGVNLGVKYYFRSMQEARRVQQLQTENLAQQLEALRYQINPHFFMNTLNNIHALVDIDPEKAKESILVLSKLMRYILYEGNRPTIPLTHEADFLRHYVTLMRMRYPESVRIGLTLPEDPDGAEVPPLVFASSVENAFKHGISYEAESHVLVSVSLENGRVLFRCTNSRHDAPKTGGLGLENVRKRLELLYGADFSLQTEVSDREYDIRIDLPQTPPSTPALP